MVVTRVLVQFCYKSIWNTKTIATALRSLNKAEQIIRQLMLVTLMENTFTLTFYDYRPLKRIFEPKQAFLKHAASRVVH